MAGKAEEDDEDDEELVRWRVTDGSSEAEVHPATNVLHPDRFRLWQTQQPCDDAWLVVEPRPRTAFSRVEIVNAGSSLVEIYGLRDGSNDYELLLSPQQVMTVKDLLSKANRNRALAYDIDMNRKLSPVAAQQRWTKLRIRCRQPFGTTEHRACIGLAYISFTTCKPRGEDGIYSAAKRKVPLEVVRSYDERKHQKKVKQIVQQDSAKPECQEVTVKPEPQDNDALLPERRQIPGLGVSMSELKIRKQSAAIEKDFVEERKPRIGTVMKQDTVVAKAMKPKLVIGMGAVAATTTTDPAECQAFRLASSPFLRKDHDSVSKMKSRSHSPDRKEVVGNKKPKIEDVKEEVAVRSDNVQISPCTLDRTRKVENVDIGVSAAQAEGKSEHSHAKRSIDEVAQATKLNSAQVLGNAGRVKHEGLAGSSSVRTGARIEDFAKVLEGVVFAISGIQNPARGLFRAQGLEMGAQYRPDWTSDCTILVCAFKDTPKFKQVKADGGSIVSKEWISECHKQRKLVSIERFFMHKGKPWRKTVYKINCGSLEEVEEWVYDDLASTSNWLQQRDPKPEPEELEFTAAQGIMVCFEDSIKCIQNNQSVSSIVESWGCLPRGIKELAAMEDGRAGYKKGTRSHMLAEAARLKLVYIDILNPIFVACSKTPQSVVVKKKR